MSIESLIKEIEHYLEYPVGGKREQRNSRLRISDLPCACCGYPLTERHHLLPFSQYGENALSLYLCPNCHWLYHKIVNKEQKLLISHLINGSSGQEKVYWENYHWLSSLAEKIEQIQVEKQLSLIDIYG